MDFSAALLVICFCVLICLLFFLDIFGTFFRRPSPASSTVVFLSSFCCCLLFQLKDFLLACLSAPIFSSWLRSSYALVFVGVAAVSLRFLVECPLWLESWVSLVPTLNFPNLDQRPGFLAVCTWFPNGSWRLGVSCGVREETFASVFFVLRCQTRKRHQEVCSDLCLLRIWTPWACSWMHSISWQAS